MLSSKFIGYFLDEVTDWQTKLSNADSVINVWFEVQRAWMHLESIFIGSEDIRSQLPEDSKRFEKIDRDFKVINRKLLKIWFAIIQLLLVKKKSLTGSFERHAVNAKHRESDE